MNEFDLHGESYEGVHTGHEWGKDVISHRKHNLGSLVLGTVCEVCNNGWMSNLESATRSKLLQLIKASQGRVSLTYNDQRTLSHWAFKTSCVLNRATNYRVLMPQEDIWAFYRNRHLPAALTIEIYLAEHVKGVFAVQGQNMVAVVMQGAVHSEQQIKEAATRIYVITLNVCGVHFRVSWTPFDRSHVDIHLEANAYRIWPPQRHAISIPAGARTAAPKLFFAPTLVSR